ncbi:MAG: PIG-L family deacetylase [Thermoleophilia bacterium]
MEPVPSEMQSDSTDPALPALFLFAHHDDEIFISATLQLLAGRGDVSAVWVTRGGLHGGKREAESRRAMDILGVDPQRQHFFRLADGRALDYADEVISRLTRLILRLKPASVFVPAFEGGHPDHDIVQLAAAEAIRRGAVDKSGARRRPALYEFPLYNRCATRFISVGEFIPDATPTLRTAVKLRDRLIRRKLMITFRSQRPITWPLLGFKGGPMMLHHAGEPYRRVPAERDYAVRPHPGRLAYEFYTPVRFGRFAEKAALLQAERRRN